MGFKVGVRFLAREPVCKDAEDCKSKNPSIVPGTIYEARVKLTARVPWAAPEGLPKLWETIKGVRRKYPGICINYLEASDDGKSVIIQLFDPEAERLGGPYYLLAVLALILGILIATIVVLKLTFAGLPREKWWWYLVAAGGAAVAVGYLIRSVR